MDAEKRAGETGFLSTTPWAEECEQDRREAEPAWTEVVKNGRHKKKNTGMQNEQGQGVEEEELTEEYNQNSRLDMDRSLARLREERQRTSTPHKRVGDSRQGDWTCKDVKCAWQNFAWRRVCMKCSKDRRGLMGPEQGAVVGTQGVAPGRRENAIRHPKLLILSINLTKDGKTGQRPRWEDHVNIMRQAGLNLDEVRGKVGKNGYLEVALEPGSTSAVGALRELSKEVDTRYTIQSVREQGASREVTVRWVGVPFSVTDETLYSYLELFSKPVRQGRNLWWEKDEPGEGLREVWNAERTLVVHLNQGVSHVPVWHYVGGTKLKLLVPSRRSCPRCMKPAGECKGGGVWASCEESGNPQGDWKEEQEKFLKNVGSSLELQKALEKDLKEVEVGPEDPEIVAQMKAEAERMEDAAKEREVLVQRVPKGKVCGGLRLQHFPEGAGNRKTEKRETLLTIIDLCNNLSQEEEERLGGAGVELSRPERGRKGTVDVKITLDQADELLRKVWDELEVPCREEGVKRYMVEASTDMSPVKAKPKTAFQQAKSRVVGILKIEGEERKKEAERQMRKSCGGKDSEEGRETHKEGAPQDSAAAKEVQNPPEHTRNLSQEKTPPGPPEKLSSEEDGPSKRSLVEEEAVLLQEEVQAAGRPVPEILETLRLKGQKWIPPQGKRRCSGNCIGCQRKCKELGLEDCNSCYLNKEKNTNSNGCCNREECTNLRIIRVRKLKSGQDLSLSAEQSEISQVDSIVHDFENKGVDQDNIEREEDLQKGLKRGRVKGGTPEDLKRNSQIAKMSNSGGPSKLIAPRKTSLPTK